MDSAACWESKIWGLVQHVFLSNQAAISVLQVERGFQCSKHYHNYRVNQFTVISGKLLIQEFPSVCCDCPVCSGVNELVLGPGQSYKVYPGRVHRFRVLQSGKVVEVYWGYKEHDVVSIDDIVRLDEGGPCYV